jgi:hypothetical protein
VATEISKEEQLYDDVITEDDVASWGTDDVQFFDGDTGEPFTVSCVMNDDGTWTITLRDEVFTLSQGELVRILRPWFECMTPEALALLKRRIAPN